MHAYISPVDRIFILFITAVPHDILTQISWNFFELFHGDFRNIENGRKKAFLIYFLFRF